MNAPNLARLRCASWRYARLFALATAICCAAAFPAGAKTAQPDNFRLAKISFVGLSRYNQAQATAALGLHVGDSIGAEQLKAAADLLAKSGVFDSVAYRYSTLGGDLDVEFQVVETQALLPCRFENFIWFSPEQLDETLRRRVPFYTGAVPPRGSLTQQVSDALQALVTANGIHGTVEFIAFSSEVGAPVSALLFRVSGIAMPVRSLTFPGASALSEKELASAIPDLVGKDFSATDAEVAVSGGLAPLYHRHGYLEARFDHPRPAIVPGTASDITVAIPVVEGPQFSWSKADWTGNHAFSSDDLTKLLNMKVGEVADLDKIDAGFAAIGKAYQGKGYIDAKVQPTQTLDSAARQASFQVAVDEGPEYHMGELQFQGLADKLAADLAKKWNVKMGQVYDANYGLDFLKQVLAPKLRDARMTGRVAISLQRDAAKATVDVVISIQ
ncbi:MAG TPA: POTRA domain-containing protein [Candidatus Baltobacteraceae bacterium]|nr:POTRA domain-containing protein [Candidatus Baltobacteraceae bacterium]